jgi:hypothetical protein
MAVPELPRAETRGGFDDPAETEAKAEKSRGKYRSQW